MVKLDQYLNFKEFKEIMAFEDFKMSQAVKVYLSKAVHYHKIQVSLKKAVVSHPHNLALAAELDKAIESRIENVWLAIETAEAEKLQGWRYLEDGSDFVNTLLIKYEGQLEKCTHLERLKTEYIEILEETQQKMIKNGVGVML